MRETVKIANRLACVAIASAVAGLTGPVAAQRCLTGPQGLPHGLSGPPTWFDTSQDMTSTAPVYASLNDPRWANAGLTRYDGSADSDRYRVMYDNDIMLVSVHTAISMTDQVDSSEAVFFGVTNGTVARAVKIGLATSSVGAGQPQPIVNSFQEFIKDPSVSSPATAWPNPGDLDYPQDGVAAPSWLKVSTLWPNESSVSWGLNFKVDLGSSGLNFPAGTMGVRYFIGTMKVDSAINAHNDPAVPSGDPALWDFGGVSFGLKDWTAWRPLQPLGAACTGVQLKWSGIGADDAGTLRSQVPYLNPDMTYAQNNMIARPVVNNPDFGTVAGAPEFKPAPADVLEARFRVAKWGSQASIDFNNLGAWSPLKDAAAGNPEWIPYTSAMAGADPEANLQCPANNASSVCGIPLADVPPPSWNPDISHQCMLVEMRPTGVGTDFANSSVYRNMDFARASTVSRPATIDVSGLAAIAGDNASRDIYLYVRRRNMPPVGSAELTLPQNAMYNAKFEVTGEFDCTDEAASCTYGLCTYACDSEGICPPGTSQLESNACLCAPYPDYELCAPEPDTSSPQPSLDDTDKLAESWPTYEVFAYWDTGKTATVNGQTYPVFKDLTSFGLFVDHTGPYLGFTDTITGLNGAIINETAPGSDIYKITIPSEGSADILVEVTAVENEGDVPLIEIHGSASSWGIVGYVEIVSLDPSNKLVNLRQATLTMEKLLSESGNELVSTFSAPMSMSPLPGALPTVATFVGPGVIAEVIDLPLLGRLSTIVSSPARVNKPAACGFFGTANLTTAFTLNEVSGKHLSFVGEEPWSCVPFAMFNN